MRHAVAAIALALVLPGCSTALKAVTGLVGGGPSVTANVQAAKTATQTVGTTQITEQKVVRPTARTFNQSADDAELKAEVVGEVTIHQDVPVWIWAALIVALFLDSPRRWPGQIMRGFRGGDQVG